MWLNLASVLFSFNRQKDLDTTFPIQIALVGTLTYAKEMGNKTRGDRGRSRWPPTPCLSPFFRRQDGSDKFPIVTSRLVLAT